MQPNQKTRTISERFFDRLEKLLSDRKNPDSAFQKISRSFRAGLTIATVACFIVLIGLIFLLKGLGERNWLLSVLLFVPAAVWLIPFFLLTPFHLMARPRLCWITVMALLAVFFVYLDFHWSFSAGESKAGLTLLSNNMGGRKFTSLEGFLKKYDSDLIALQDTGKVVGLREHYPERFVSTLGEYVFVSKLPIRKSGALSELTYRGRPIGSWHELQYEDQSIVVYNIHMPTPRSEFNKLRGRGLIVEMIGGKGIYSSEARSSYREFLEKRDQLRRGLADVLEKEQRPFLVAGDFNMASHGYSYKWFGSNLKDAFGEKGRGYGFTFPGASGGLLNLFGSWLRLDYLFASKKWQVNWCRVEPRGAAEHRAIIAGFELDSTANKP